MFHFYLVAQICLVSALKRLVHGVLSLYSTFHSFKNVYIVSETLAYVRSLKIPVCVYWLLLYLSFSISAEFQTHIWLLHGCFYWIFQRHIIPRKQHIIVNLKPLLAPVVHILVYETIFSTPESEMKGHENVSRSLPPASPRWFHPNCHRVVSLPCSKVSNLLNNTYG